MKKIIATITLSLCAPAAFAQQVSAPTMLPDGTVSAPSVDSQDVSATATATDVSAPYVAAMDCCAVSTQVSAAQVSAPHTSSQDDSGALSMAGLGFGLFGLMGVTKLARRKKQKGTETL